MKFLERIEDVLRQYGHYKSTGRLINFQVSLESHFRSARKVNQQNQWIQQQNQEERRGFSLVQRRLYLQEEIAALGKLQDQQQPLTAEQQQSLRMWEEELPGFTEEWWHHIRAWYAGLRDKPKGPLIRRWELSIQNYFLYSENSQLRCKANAGCCLYDCGCCKRKLDTPWNEGRAGGSKHTRIGHCTMECGCCIRRRGFYKPVKENRSH